MGDMGERIAKCLLRVDSLPLIIRQLRHLYYDGVDETIVLTGFQGDLVEATIAESSSAQCGRVTCIREDEPLGMFGALWNAQEAIGNDAFLLVLGDLYCPTFSFTSLIRAFETSDADAMFVVHPNDHPSDSELVGLSDQGAVTEIISKYQVVVPAYCRNYAMAGISVLPASLFERFTELGASLGEMQLLLTYYKIAAYQTGAYIKDIGTPQRFAEVAKDVLLGRTSHKQQPAVFLDRDGVINNTGMRTGGFVNSPDDFVMDKDAPAAIRKLREAGFRVVCVTNQGGISLGYLKVSDLYDIHAKMDTLLAEEGAYLDRTYYCPHYPAIDTVPCICRKPHPGMFLRAASDLNLDLTQSFMVGDSASDLVAGKNAQEKLRTVWIDTGLSVPPANPSDYDFTTGSLHNAAQLIIAEAAK